MSLLRVYDTKGLLECGLDEAGAGCLAGPVYAAAVIWPQELEEYDEFYLLCDSKRLSEKQRLILEGYIKNTALDYSVASVSVEIIDKINILNARIQAMHKAVEKLDIVPDVLLVDGNRFKDYYHDEIDKIPHKLVVGGDNHFQSIAAASILAKNERDRHIVRLHEDHTEYNWRANKGYGTPEHFRALQDHGTTDHHRMSFNLHLNNNAITDF